MNIEETPEYREWVAAKSVELENIAFLSYAIQHGCEKDEFATLISSGIRARVAAEVCLERLARRRAADMPKSVEAMISEESTRVVNAYSEQVADVLSAFRSVHARLHAIEASVISKEAAELFARTKTLKDTDVIFARAKALKDADELFARVKALEERVSDISDRNKVSDVDDV